MPEEQRLKQLMNKYPAIEDLRRRARRRIPFVAWEYMETGTGAEGALRRNRQRLDAITFVPRFMKGELSPDLRTQLLGRTYSAPFGVAPVGLMGLMWPQAEQILARMASQYGIPFCLSTVATQTPEAVGPLAGEMGWFQLYPPREPALRAGLLQRARQAGFHTLVVTVDVPAPGRRERSTRAGLRTPPKITPRFLWQGLLHPAWSVATLRAGLPRLRTVETYAQGKDLATVGDFVRFKFRANLDWEYLKAVRDIWQGPLLVKGLLHPQDAEKCIQLGVDGICVSNHGGRQFDGAPAAIDALPAVARVAKGKTALLFDSGLRSGLDIMRALARGADFVLLGRAYLYGVSALGKEGGAHTTEILMAELKNNMAQMGIQSVEEIKTLSLTEELLF